MRRKQRSLRMGQQYKVIEYLKANQEGLKNQPFTVIAQVTATELGFEVSPSTIASIVKELDLPFTRRGHTSSGGKLRQAVEELEGQVAELQGRIEYLESQLGVNQEQNGKPADGPGFAQHEKRQATQIAR
jgi:TolA-binding protein